MRLIGTIFLLFAPLYGGETLYEQGKTLYFEKGCNGCHGIKAEGMTDYPALANRAKGFLAFKLREFRSGRFQNQIAQLMIPFAKPLSDEDIDALTTFLHDFVDEQSERYNPDYETWGDGGS